MTSQNLVARATNAARELDEHATCLDCLVSKRVAGCPLGLKVCKYAPKKQA